MKRIIFFDRDGTLIVEPPEDFQVDSFDKLEFKRKVISNMAKLRRETDFEFVIVTNQDGLGTDSFPEKDFWPAHNKMLQIFEGEGIVFDDILIDRSFPDENAPTRKPATGMLKKYLNTQVYDLHNSYVIGDRLTDIELAKNLGTKSVFFAPEKARKKLEEYDLSEHCQFVSDDWDTIYEFLILPERVFTIERKTSETQIHIKLSLDGKGQYSIDTGLNFFDHMLEQIARHADCDIDIRVNGDLHVDEHHTIEDTALALGEAFSKALGDKKGINRYGFLLPMDDSLARVAIDFSGRPWLVWDVEFKREKIGDVPTEMFKHFFKSFSDSAKCNLNIHAEGENEHHIIEAVFKSFAKSLKIAVKRSDNLSKLPTTKGVL
jgi:imidazoleglycerol-phosphate dehydratase / histidinol-phosphatase